MVTQMHYEPFAPLIRPSGTFSPWEKESFDRLSSMAERT
jgi:hypothetical protein